MLEHTATTPLIWKKLREHLFQQMSPQNFETWIEPVEATLEGNRLTLYVPDQYFHELFISHHFRQVEDAARALGGNELEIDILCQKDTNLDEVEPVRIQSKSQPEEPEITPAAASVPLQLDDRYTFSSFVVGPSNQLAHAASMAVASDPAKNYNPLFIYGGVGLGKTHLMQAIGWEAIRLHPGIRVMYLSAEQFMNELITAVRFDKIAQFRARYRDQCDILLIDDIQFIAGKKMTQEEFFHTFNFLHSSNKHIVVTSDKYPQEIPALEERLRTRFQWGLIADIQEPELETRMAILTKKAQQDGIYLPNDVVLFLASSIQSNIRELEGSLVRLSASTRLSGREISLDMAREVLRDLLPNTAQHSLATVELIQKCVADHFDIELNELVGSKRHKQVLIPRQVAMYLCRKLAKLSYPEIGDKFGGKDHSTVINACQKIEKLITQDDDLRSAVLTLELQLQR